MKKNFITQFTMMSFMAFTLCFTFTACGEDNGINLPSPISTVFSSDDDDATRTFINNKGRFFWEKGDKIWIYDGTDWKQSGSSNITGTQGNAKFIVEGVFTGDNYKVLYTGYTNNDTTATSHSAVTIADQQTQKAWNDGSHLGTSGDCGTARAHKKPGGYQFQLEHKASYLIFYPYIAESLPDSYTLKKIEIIADGQNIAGRYNFTFENGLYTSDGQPATPITGTESQQITLTCKDGFQLSKDIPDVTSTTTTPRHCFVVIAPGTHRLSFKYTATNNTTGQDEVFWKDRSDTKYDPNGVYPYIHELANPGINRSMTFRESNTFYQWGAASEWVSSDAVYNTEPTNDLTNGSWRNLRSLSQAYIYFRTRPYWDNTQEWNYVRKDNTIEIQRGGAWVMKRTYQSALPETGQSSYVPILGRPAESELSKYFFLPAFHGLTTVTHFWTKTPNGTSKAYSFDISSARVGTSGDHSKHTRGIANSRPTTGNPGGSGSTEWLQ